ncbi:MAG: calcium/sodium antiporter [Planctomycetaceae bacterium]|jgi:cation:H+ antiporter|nr:calcium/sodium antiporter [Planctomycetaceae bacterium]
MTIAAGFALGMFALVVGADWLVKGSVRLAERLRISSLVIGLTVVAFGTSAPELAVTMQAVANGSPEIAIGNVVGSNIQNLMLVLGLSAMFVSLKVSRRILWFDMPLLLVLTAAIGVMSMDGFISQDDGLLLFGTLAVYTWLSIKHGRTDEIPPSLDQTKSVSSDLTSGKAVASKRNGTMPLSVLQVIAGLYLLAEGGHLFVEAARSLALRFGMSELTIGVTVVAFGTSLPEIVTCVLAAIRGHRDLAVGNVIGSNIFNILCVLGLTSATSAGGLPLSTTAVGIDIPLMLGVTILTYAVCLTGNRIVRGEGLLMLMIFGSYVGWLVPGSDAAMSTRNAIVGFGVGLTLLLVGFQIHALSRQRWLPLPNR